MKKKEAVRKLHALVCELAGSVLKSLPEPRTDDGSKTLVANTEEIVRQANAILESIKDPEFFLKPTKEEQKIWDGGERIKAIQGYRHRTQASLESSFCVFKGITAEEYRNRNKFAAE
jgi:hypothetical protein